MAHIQALLTHHSAVVNKRRPVAAKLAARTSDVPDPPPAANRTVAHRYQIRQ